VPHARVGRGTGLLDRRRRVSGDRHRRAQEAQED
jgi:hypothetical protein